MKARRTLVLVADSQQSSNEMGQRLFFSAVGASVPRSKMHNYA
jgi:hypothetical protein